MLKPILIAACVALPPGLIQAQDATDPSPPQGGSSEMPGGGPEMSQDGGQGDQPGTGPGGGHGMMEEGHPGPGNMQEGHGGHGMGMMMRHHPEMMRGRGGGAKGFVLQTGEDSFLRVTCGDETMAECLEAVQPLIDQMSGTGGSQ